jgi:hypothetical protein
MKIGHNMLVLMFDARLKSMQLIITFLTHENVAIIVAKYDQELLLPLLIKATKLLKICNFKATLKFFFKPHQQMQTLLGTSCQENFLNCVDMWLMLKTTNVPYLGGTNNKTSL